ncbi:hypothetical protein [uncultured Nocardioides sp.]|uniref:hypothetical protein n=1 Tax=uncultured Nocardioides sp. TaxID=198441 RepID=UPI0026032DB6|nr:hypothetical protein [uncultured Nocardioides sp.]
MSDQLTSQSRPSSGISRRTALRGAAWSASAVTVVVATPNIAAASGGTAPLTFTGALTTAINNETPVKYNDRDSNSVKHVKWQDLRFANTGTGDLADLNIEIILSENSPTNVEFTVSSAGGVWTTSGSGRNFAATYEGVQDPLEPNDVLTFTPNFKGANNSGGSMTVRFFYGSVMLGEKTGTWKPA